MDWLAAQADPILALAGLVFVTSLVPQAWHQFRTKSSTTPLTTSVPTALTLAVITMVFAGLELWLTVATDVFTTVLWAIIAGQRIRYGAPRDGHQHLSGGEHEQ